MGKATFKGTVVEIAGELPAVGRVAPGFNLVAEDLSNKTLVDFSGKIKIISIVPSLDTKVCAISAMRFNQEVSKLKKTVLINVSADLPFAQKRFCESNSLNNIVTLSTFRSNSFGEDYGVRIQSGPLAGLMCRAVLVLDVNDKVVYAERVPEITDEPNYEASLSTAKFLETK